MDFDPQPTLVGEGVTLRPLRPGDREALFAIASDQELWAGHPAHDRWRPEVFGPFFEKVLATGGGMVIEDKAGNVIGSSAFYDVTETWVKIGFTYLARGLWGSGVNAEVKRLMVGHVHRSRPSARFDVGRVNARSQAAMRKVGAVLLPAGPPGRPDDLTFEIRRD